MKMVDFENIQDVSSAILVIIFVSIVIALAWMSTYVREQPLIATAVVVLQQQVPPQSSSQEEQTTNQTDEPSEPNMDDSQSSSQSTESVKRENCPSEGSSRENTISNENSCTSNSVLDESSITPANDVERENLCSSVSENRTSEFCNSNNSLLDSELQKDIRQSSEDNRKLSELKRSVDLKLDTCSSNTHDNFKDMKSSEPKTSTSSPENISASSDYLNAAEKQDSENKQEKSTSASSSEELNEAESQPPGSIKIRLKFLDDTQKVVFAFSNEKVITFKRYV